MELRGDLRFRRDHLQPLNKSIAKRKVIEGTSFLMGYSRMRERVLKHVADVNGALVKKIDF
jgi:hypothetical protein